MKVKDLVSMVGSKARLASLLNISAAAVSQWGDEVPELRRYQINEILDGAKSKKQAA